MYFDIMKLRIQNNLNTNNNNFDFKKFKNEIAELIKSNNHKKVLESQKEYYSMKSDNEIDYNINFMAPNTSKNLNEIFNNYNLNMNNFYDKNLIKSRSAERFNFNNMEYNYNSPNIDNYNKDLNNLLFHQYLNQRENNQRISEELNDIKNEIKIGLNRIEIEQKHKLNNLSLLLSQNKNKNILPPLFNKMINKKNNYHSLLNNTNIGYQRKPKNTFRKNKSENYKMKLKLLTKINDSDADV